MRIVDASVVCDFLLGDPTIVEEVIGGAQDPADPLYCAAHTELEVLNAFRGLERAKRLPPDQAERAIQELARMRLLPNSVGSLQPRIWELRHNLTAYDAAYVALTEQVRNGVLLTRDRGLATVARESLGDARVQLI